MHCNFSFTRPKTSTTPAQLPLIDSYRITNNACDKVYSHIVESNHEMERVRAANHYDMAGHGAKAEELLR